MKKKVDLRALAPAEMKKKLDEMDEQSFRLKFQMSMGQTSGIKRIRENRRDRARLLTYLRQHELETAQKGAK